MSCGPSRPPSAKFPSAAEVGAGSGRYVGMSDDGRLYLPWYEASPEGLDELAQIKRVVDQLRERPDGRRR